MASSEEKIEAKNEQKDEQQPEKITWWQWAICLPFFASIAYLFALAVSWVFGLPVWLSFLLIVGYYFVSICSKD